MAAVPESTQAWSDVGLANRLRLVFSTTAGARRIAPVPVAEATTVRPFAAVGRHDDLSREVYCILGMPVDAVLMPEVLERIDSALDRAAPLFISTPNLNFLTTCRTDPEFRESLLRSDLCPADGMPIVWIARLMGIPIKKRVAGSDIYAALRAAARAKPLGVFFFGGCDGAAAAARDMLNAERGGLNCVGTLAPGFGTVADMSRDGFIDEINATKADFLIASLGAQKGQFWLLRNYHRIRIPIRAHLGAALNIEAGHIKRAPVWMRESGFEWLWRILQEPHLWRRYWHDGNVLLRLLLTQVLPLTIAGRWMRRRYRNAELKVVQSQDHRRVTLKLSGVAAGIEVDRAVSSFRKALALQKDMAVDLSDLRFFDQRFLGLLLLLRKQLSNRGADLHVTGVSAPLKKLFRLNGAEFLLTHEAT